ncbi:MAG: ribonuclease P protein component [Bacteroidales bacterium]|nr:ribonuclease P protein component [Bacteroidales bacterium]MBR5063885.1 ribonuclease P protein component [Bacteroidales bacterium]
MTDETLSKSERLCGKKAVEALFGQGKGGVKGCLRFRYVQREDEGPSRILVSVPKRSFKRAVKRNLLKRRIREAYRRQKALLPAGTDILFIYNAPEVLPYADIYADMTAVLTSFAS